MRSGFEPPKNPALVSVDLVSGQNQSYPLPMEDTLPGTINGVFPTFLVSLIRHSYAVFICRNRSLDLDPLFLDD